MAKEYEVIRELCNPCSGGAKNGDITISEIEAEDLDAYVKGCYPNGEVRYQKRLLDGGAVVFEVDASGLTHRYTFTEI